LEIREDETPSSSAPSSSAVSGPGLRAQFPVHLVDYGGRGLRIDFREKDFGQEVQKWWLTGLADFLADPEIGRVAMSNG
jgi:hypothetical protein